MLHFLDRIGVNCKFSDKKSSGIYFGVLSIFGTLNKSFFVYYSTYSYLLLPI